MIRKITHIWQLSWRKWLKAHWISGVPRCSTPNIDENQSYIPYKHCMLEVARRYRNLYTHLYQWKDQTTHGSPRNEAYVFREADHHPTSHLKMVHSKYLKPSTIKRLRFFDFFDCTYPYHLFLYHLTIIYIASYSDDQTELLWSPRPVPDPVLDWRWGSHHSEDANPRAPSEAADGGRLANNQVASIKCAYK